MSDDVSAAGQQCKPLGLCGVKPSYLPNPPPRPLLLHIRQGGIPFLCLMDIYQPPGWQLRGVKYCFEKGGKQKEKTNEEGRGVSKCGRFKIHPGAMWENYEPPFPGCPGCV